MSKIHKIRLKTERVLNESIFGAFYTLWTAPIDQPKLKMPAEKITRESSLRGLLDNLIIGHGSP
ncbi:hypothetical protein HYU45_03245 [Candidatus Daviesbacteria bacterium]|nr:hypothetical protein [Candidatus Daviesbacteria bacterium]